MRLSRKNFQFANRLLGFWEERDLISPEQSQILRQSIERRSIAWHSLATYAFYCTLLSGILAIVAIVLDDELLDLLLKLFDTSSMTKSAGLALMAVLVFGSGFQFGLRHMDRLYSKESIYFFGVLLVVSSVWFLGDALNDGSGHYSLLILLVAVVYLLVSLFLSSLLVWLCGLLALIVGYMTETDYQTGESLYFYGMNLPVRLAVFGGGLLFTGHLLLLTRKLASFFSLTRLVSLLCLFSGLWLVSIFGNHGDWNTWSDVRQSELWLWHLPLTLACLLAIIAGLVFMMPVYNNHGIIFFLIQLYTVFFQFAWDSVHKALFFAVLGLSFWLLGRSAEMLHKKSA